MSDTPNTLGATPPPMILAFYTTGDKQPIGGMLYSDWFRKRAESLASPGQAYGAATVSEATDKIRNLPANLRLLKVYFVGHGFIDGYFFHGARDPDPHVEFAGDTAELLQAPSVDPSYKTFFDELAKHFNATDLFEIGFICCYSGTNNLVTAICSAMDNKKYRNFTVGAYIHEYETYNSNMRNGVVDPTGWRDKIVDKSKPKDPNFKPYQSTTNDPPAYEKQCHSSNPLDPLQGILP